MNRVDRKGGTCLDDAHRHKYVDVIKFLRSEGAKFGSTSQVTNFIGAASEGDREEVEAFLEFGGIDINQGDYDLRWYVFCLPFCTLERGLVSRSSHYTVFDC